MNSSVWAQCDAIYVAFVLFSFYAALKDRRIAMWLLWGVAIAFKLQATFFLPVLIYLWLASKKSRIYDPLLALIPFVLGLLPPLLAGQPIDSVLSVYVVQGVTYPHLSANAASIFGLYPFGPAGFIPVGRLVAIAAVGSLLVFALLKMKMDRQKSALLAFATVSVLLLPFLLPQMHERYFYLAEIFSLLLACLSVRMVWVAAAIQFASAITYLVEFLNDDALPIGLPILSLIMGAALVGLALYFVKYHSTVKFKS
jgi:Gpi18-like mannosyltransferase